MQFIFSINLFMWLNCHWIALNQRYIIVNYSNEIKVIFSKFDSCRSEENMRGIIMVMRCPSIDAGLHKYTHSVCLFSQSDHRESLWPSLNRGSPYGGGACCGLVSTQLMVSTFFWYYETNHGHLSFITFLKYFFYDTVMCFHIFTGCLHCDVVKLRSEPKPPHNNNISTSTTPEISGN